MAVFVEFALECPLITVFVDEVNTGFWMDDFNELYYVWIWDWGKNAYLVFRELIQLWQHIELIGFDEFYCEFLFGFVVDCSVDLPELAGANCFEKGVGRKAGEVCVVHLFVKEI